MTKLKKNDKVTYEKKFNFGKVGMVTAKVVIVKGNKLQGFVALLDNGEEVFTANDYRKFKVN